MTTQYNERYINPDYGQGNGSGHETGPRPEDRLPFEPEPPGAGDPVLAAVEKLLHEQRRTNALLERMGVILSERLPLAPHPQAPPQAQTSPAPANGATRPQRERPAPAAAKPRPQRKAAPAASTRVCECGCEIKGNYTTCYACKVAPGRTPGECYACGESANEAFPLCWTCKEEGVDPADYVSV